MAYTAATLTMIGSSIGGKQRVWEYFTTDALSVVLAANYFSDAGKKGLKVGDRVRVSTGTYNTLLTTTPSTAAEGGVSAWASTPSVIECIVSGVTAVATGGAGTVIALPGVIGGTASALVGFYGAAPAAQQAVLTAVTTTQPSVTTFGFTTTAQFNDLIAKVNSIIAYLKTYGLVATA